MITSLQVLDATVLPDGANAAVPNGWVAKVTLPDDGVSAFDPTKIALTVEDPGFSGPNVAATQTRTITGTAIIRKQYPNQAQRLNSAAAGVRTVYFALSEEIYAGSTITGATAADGYYGAAAAGAIDGVSNASTLAYPQPVFAWLNMQHERAVGAGFAVEAVVYHRHAQGGQQVAGIEFWGRDAQAVPNLSPVVAVSSPALSSFQTQGQIVESWQATIATANLTQGDLCQALAKVYPWIGPAFDISVSGFGTLLPGSNVDDPRGATPLRFLCDKTGGYGGAVAYVRVGGTLAGTSSAGVFTGPQAYPVAAGSCYPDLNAALQAIVLSNNAGRGHNDHSGATVYLMDDGAGGAVDHAITGTSSRTAGKCWTDVKIAPGATGAVRFTVTGLIATADLLRFFVPFYINASGNNALDGVQVAGTKRIAFEGVSLVNGITPGVGLIYRLGLSYWRNCTVTDAYTPWGKFGGNRTCPALVLGCTGNVVTSTIIPYTFVGNRLSGASLFSTGDANWFSQSGAIIANNILHKMPSGAKFGDTAAIDGFARVQNVFETAAGFSAGDAAWLPSNGASAFTFTNVLSMHNTIPGVGVGSSNQARQNGIYADTATTAGVQKQMLEKYDLLHQRNTKGDTFTDLTTVTGRTGTWRYRYGVGSVGIVVVTGDASGGLSSAPDPSGGSWLGEYLEPGSTVVAGEANVVFVDNKSGSGGVGGGTYALANAGGGTHAARGRVPAGKGVLKYDLAGVARKQDGTGAAGAYERTDL